MTRIAIVKKERCNPGKCNWLCIKLCPINRTGQECIIKGEDSKASIDEFLCTGCGICPKRCPFEAISIINLPEELKQNPIHCYGKNGFHLYNLPAPLFGKVTGILGKNAIGKSTALKILAGILKPNLGKEKAGYDELIEFFKGTEAQIFFEQLKKGKIKTSYKPQQVDLIPKQYKGKVLELLKRVDERQEFDKIVEELELKEILNHDIKKISGGELQRVAIAACALKKANVYFFDEPTSYLDIKQRIKISKFIRSLVKEDTAVVVVEHDLIILDYMTDLIHLMYGKSACYGITSMPKATRSAINIYLSGYLREENIRFRNYEIKFLAKPPVALGKKEILTSWTGIKKTLNNFELEAPEGQLNKNQVIGILGENAIGKTTFVKILADVIKSDKSRITQKIKASYKPQYLGGSDEVVAVILKGAIQKYEVQLIRPLELKNLLTRRLNQLSGGELQRVAIALCLSKEADLYLLDEPSAYLDVEQRLVVSKLIKDLMEDRGKTALVVDHDLLFINYLSEELIVFEGQPAKFGKVKGPFKMEEGMNSFLKELKITMRRDPESLRPRINKSGSRLDREQKSAGRLYYS